MSDYQENAGSGSGEYYYANGRRVPLQREPGAFAIKYKPQARVVDSALPRSIERLLSEDAEMADFVPAYGIRVYTAARAGVEKFATAERADAELARLNAAPGIEFATPVYRQTPQSRTPMYATNRILLCFRPEATEEERAELHATLGGEVVEKLGWVGDGYAVALRNEKAGSVVAIANAYAESPLVDWAHPDFIRTMATKSVDTAWPRDGAYAGERDVEGDQAATRGVAEDWHIRLARVDAAWGITRGRSDVRVAVIDDGCDTGHAEFQGRIVTQFDFMRFIADGNPKSESDSHGTCCTSVATAAGRRALGAAPGCSIMAIRMGRFATSDEARMFAWVADQGADVISCSWGPTDGDGPFPLPDATRAAIDYCVDQGRGGKGIPVFFAAGNGNELISDDGYASYHRVMAIAASTSEDTRAPYSDFGPEIFIAAPSNGGSRGIFAADRRGNDGYNPERGGPADTDYFDRFGGTSSATPLAAGVAALMISANDEITQQQIREIMATTAEHIGSPGDYDATGHSELYGFGRLDAGAAVEAARDEPSTANGARPSIAGPASASRTGAAPSFEIGLGGRRLFAVEIATQPELFDANGHGHERNSGNFYASWTTGLSSTSPWQMPQEAWERLRGASRLHYRAHVADSTAWANHAVTTPDGAGASAPSLSITEGSGTGTGTGSGGPVSGGALLIDAPASIGRSGPAPQFTINKGGRQFYAVEVATRAELFDANGHGHERTDDNFFASWRTGLSQVTPYRMPEDAWARLRQADRIWYRLHVADDANWSNYDVSTSDSNAAEAKSSAIVGATGTGTGAGTGTGTGGGARPASLVFASGVSFATADAPADGSHDDPVGFGLVPLIDVAGKSFSRLSTNFRVSEFTPRNARLARISPDLVEGLQAIRSALGSGLEVVRGYTPPPGQGGEDWHVTGLAAQVRAARATPLQLADLALRHVGPRASLGLGRDWLSVDFRPVPVLWAEAGAAMDTAGFEAFAAERGAARGLREDGLLAMGVEGPESVLATAAPPEIYVETGGAAYVAVEFATDPALFFDPDRRTPETFHGTWQEGRTHAPLGRCVLSLPEPAWRALGGHGAVYYRAVGADTDTADWTGFRTSLREADRDRAPRITVRGTERAVPTLGVRFIDLADRRAAERALWSDA